MTSHPTSQFLDSFVNFEAGSACPADHFFRLRRIENLLKELGHPQRHLKCIHVAGTKGKGTTCVFAAHILEKAGYRVGLYTSPHLQDVTERIRILKPGQGNKCTEDIFPDSISHDELGGLIEENRSVFEKFRTSTEHGPLTYFEVLTALAFIYFRQQAVDFAVLETGLGGRLDATNVVDPYACGLTPISLEHVAILGGTISRIAAEKAAIIKLNKPVVVAPQTEEAKDVIREKGRRENARLYFVGEDIIPEPGQSSAETQSFCIKGLRAKYQLSTRLLGLHQIMNAATAVGLVESLGQYDIDIPSRAVCRGIEATFWPCRFEIIRKTPWIVLDAAHNPESIRALGRTTQDVFPGKKVILVLGISKDKDIRGICRSIGGIPDEIILTRSQNPRACVFDNEIKKIFADIPAHHVTPLSGAIELALTKAQKDDVILITGSIFLAAEARGILQAAGCKLQAAGFKQQATSCGSSC